MHVPQIESTSVHARKGHVAMALLPRGLKKPAADRRQVPVPKLGFQRFCPRAAVRPSQAGARLKPDAHPSAAGLVTKRPQSRGSRGAIPGLERLDLSSSAPPSHRRYGSDRP